MSVVAVGRYLLMSKYLFLSSHKNAFALQTDDLYLQWQIFDIHKGNSPFLPQLILFAGVNKKPQKFIFEYWVFHKNPYLHT